MDLTVAAHITIAPARPQGRPGYSGAHFLRVGGGTRPVRTNLCGAALTDRDMTPRDARRTLKLGPQAVAEWNLCRDCLAKEQGV